MSLRRTITKQELMTLLVEVRREDGVDVAYQYSKKYKIYRPVTITERSAPHIYKEQQKYSYANLYNFKTKSNMSLALHRLIYAWYNGECPADKDIDHIDNDRTNNNIENLQLLDHLNNNRKKVVSRNQYTYNMTDEEILKKRESKRYIYDSASGNANKKTEWYEDYINTKKAITNKIKEYEELKAKYKKEHNLKEWRKMLILITALKARKRYMQNKLNYNEEN